MRRLLRAIIYRTRLKYIQLAEMFDNYWPNEINNNDQISNLPEVRVIQVKEQKQIESLCNIYYKNPSNLVTAPWKKDVAKAKISNGVEFYLVYDNKDILVGATGFDPQRNMFVHSVVDYRHRKLGYGKSMYLRIIDLMKEQGINEVRAQAFKENTRAIKMLLSIGFEIDLKESKETYFTMVKTSTV